ncbi:MAG: SDR family oxidoreductase [Myxococcota bacterium]
MTRRVALIPGGARGIGRGVALALARRDWDLAIAYRTSAAEAADVVTEAQAHGARALALKADVGNAEEAESLVQQAEATLGSIDALIHCAGPYHRVDILDETPEGWREMLESNLSSLFYLARLVGPTMAGRGWGRIIAFSSAHADLRAAPRMLAPYQIAKSGLIILARTLAKTLASGGVTVNVIAPGFIDSPDEFSALKQQIPAGYEGTVDDAVKLVLFLLSDDARYVNGANIHLSGAWGL